MHHQSPNQILMVRPRHFSFDSDTAKSNSFQTPSNLPLELLQQRSVQEFDQSVRLIRNAGVDVKVFEDQVEPSCPDAVFPNNWISTHDNKTSKIVVIYPMQSKARRLEKREDIVDYLKMGSSGQEAEILDLSAFAEIGRYLEGTGSIVFDYMWKRAYACTSPRTDEALFRSVCCKLGFEPVQFSAVDRTGMPIYHTNVMMWVGTRIAAVCLDAITDADQRMMVMSSFEMTGRKVLPLSLYEVEGFCGNCYEVVNENSEIILVMSKTASLRLAQYKKDLLVSMFDKIVVCDVGTIEAVGGGSIRCMIAGDYIDKKKMCIM